MFGRISDAIAHPSANPSWSQLAAMTIFVLTIALLWRQVVMMVTREF